MMGRMNVAAFLGAFALAGLTAPAAVAQTCDDGTPGLQSTSFDVCCSLECTTCGGPGCAQQNTTNGAFDCCVTEIMESNLLCADRGEAPCILQATVAPANSTCNNGLSGVQDPDSDVCCPLECGDECGGEGCGSIVGTDPSQCCFNLIMDSGNDCAVTGVPPCFDTTVAINDTTCSNGLAGVEDTLKGVCCDAACPMCGGPGCGSYPGLTGAQCCSAQIEADGALCAESGEAPCRLAPPSFAPSMCPNGLAGVQDGEVCCSESCNGQCGGEGCGAILGTDGPSDCCSATILASGVQCEQGVEAPCIMVNGTYTNAPMAAPINPIVGVGATPAPSAGDRAIDFSMAPTATGGVVPGVSMAPTGAPTAGSRAIDLTGTPTGTPTASPTGVDGMADGTDTAAPTAGSRDFAGESLSPTMAPSSTMAPGTSSPGSTLSPGLPEEITFPPAAATSAAPCRASTGSFVTVAAIAAGIFAVRAARN